MKRLLLIVALMMLPACSTLGPVQTITLPTKLSEPAKSIQTAINESRINLIAAANVIGANAEARIWTKDQAQGYLNKVKELDHKLDIAQILLDDGEIVTAQSQADLLKKAILALHREVASVARKDGK